MSNKLPAILNVDLEKIKNYSRDDIRYMIAKLEKELGELPQRADAPVTHHFSEGVYGRELYLPEGTVAIGKIHKHRTMNVLLKGELTVVTEEGCKRLKAPQIFVSEPGVKRLVITHADTIFVNFHGTQETDLQKIEDEVIAKNYDEVVYIDSERPKVITEGL